MVKDSSAIGLALNSNNDIYLENGKLATISGADFCAQNIDERINTRYGELFFNVNDGIDRHYLIHNQDIEVVASTLKNLISQTKTVESLSSFNIEQVKREVKISFSVDTIFNKNISSDITL